MSQLLSNAYEKVMGRSEHDDKIPPPSTKPDYNTRGGESSNANANAPTMKALAWFGDKDVRMIDTPIPTITEPRDAIVRVTGTTVCGSDLHLYHKEIFEMRPGDILGHEFCGIVDEVGPGVDSEKLKVGQRVVCSFQIACGQCEYCKKGLSSMCDTTNDSKLMNDMYGHRFAGIFGYAHFTGGFAGGQAEYVRVPFADVNLLPLPDDVPDEKGLYLSDVLCTSYHACYEAKIERGQTVGIWGAGPIGLLCAAWCQIMGASRVIVIDNVMDRLNRAREYLGGVEILNFDECDNVVSTVQEMCPGGIDAAIDCAGFRYTKTLLHKVERAIGLETDSSEVLNEMVKLVKKFGTIVLIADYAAYTNHFNVGGVMEKGIRLIGGGQAPVQKYWRDILTKYLQPGKLDKALKTILTHRFKLEDTPLVYKCFDLKEKGVIKTFIETKFSAPADPTILPTLSTLAASTNE